MNKEQKENLKTLLKLPELSSKHDTNFNMNEFFIDEKGNYFKYNNGDIKADDYNCHTSACLAGHLPLTTGISKKKGEVWLKYIERVVGIDQQFDKAFSDWDYLFGDNWISSLEFAVARVKYFIDNGYKAPKSYDYDYEYCDYHMSWGNFKED